MGEPKPSVGADAREVPMRVIVHGVHRTGSLSMRAALHQLGLHGCYHMTTALDRLDTDAELWIRAIEAKFAGRRVEEDGDDDDDDHAKWTRRDWDRLFGECQACVDLPSALFTLELAAAYPEAKVVLLNRDAQQWYESVLGSVQPLMARPSSLCAALGDAYLAALVPEHRHWVRLREALTRHALPFDHARDRDAALAWFADSYRRVRDAIPPSRRLDFSVADGFRPLCAFLDLPVPVVADPRTAELVDAPFPRLNDRASFAAHAERVRRARMRAAHSALLTLLCRTVTAAVLGYGAYHVWTSGAGM